MSHRKHSHRDGKRLGGNHDCDVVVRLRAVDLDVLERVAARRDLDVMTLLREAAESLAAAERTAERERRAEYLAAAR